MTGARRPLFVRGYYQLARYEPGSIATGRRLTEHEVLEAYGARFFDEMDEHLSAVLLKRTGVIEDALRRKRDQLGVTTRQVATAAELPVEVVEDAVSGARRVEIRQLEHLAFVMGLDPAQLGVEEGAGADAELGVRLRVLTRDDATPQDVRLSPRTALRFSEAASIILAQSRLQDWLEIPGEAADVPASSDYGFPAWRRGYELAGRLRDRLGIGLEPIASMRTLVEDRLGIPVIQLELPSAIAGASIAVKRRRGIVLNTMGANTNVWIRRTTLAHELAHLLFDPQNRLLSIRVDPYEQLDRDSEDSNPSQQAEEQRANAFAVEFLAPQEAVRELVPVDRVTSEAVRRVMSTFGMGRAAARFHVWNSWYRQSDLPPESSIRASPTDEQRAAENFTQDFFPIESTPARRRGRFATLTAQAFDAGLITDDTAAQYLRCTQGEFDLHLDHLRQLV